MNKNHLLWEQRGGERRGGEGGEERRGGGRGEEGGRDCRATSTSIKSTVGRRFSLMAEFLFVYESISH